MLTVFLSYAHEDYAPARRLYEELNSLPGLSVWFDKEAILPGQTWESEIQRAIRSSQFFLLLLSNRSTGKRGYYHREVREALRVLEEFPDSAIYLIPARLEECRPHLAQLETLQYVDLFPDWDSGVRRIVKAFCAHGQFDEENLKLSKATERQTEWQLHYVLGSSLELIEGMAGTQLNANGHHDTLFVQEATAILGDSNKRPPFNTAKNTAARWRIPTGKTSSARNGRCFLLFGNLRHFGGLHSPIKDDYVEIYLNDHPVDGFEIKIIPEGQTDYFHKRPFPEVPRPFPFDTCDNIYAWPVPHSHLLAGGEDTVLVRIGTRTKWDIDYVGLLFECT